MGGRDRVDPELAQLVEQRLEDLLAERGPRRTARASPSSQRVLKSSEGVLPSSERVLPSSERVVSSSERVVSSGERAAGEPGSRAADAAAHQSAERAERLELGSDDALPSRRWPTFTRAHLAVVGVIATLGVLLAGWAVLRARPVPLPVTAAAAPRTSAATPLPTASLTPSASATARASPAELVVHVLGAVRRPGLVRLPAGARVQDALDQAGGLRSGADLGDLNLAQTLTDGQQVIVGRTAASKGADAEPGSATPREGRSEVRGGASAGSGNDERGSAPQLDLNAATVTELEVLPGVGPVTAAKIVAWREQHGRFSRVEELQEVTGIGPKTYAEIAPHCRV